MDDCEQTSHLHALLVTALPLLIAFMILAFSSPEARDPPEAKEAPPENIVPFAQEEEVRLTATPEFKKK